MSKMRNVYPPAFREFMGSRGPSAVDLFMTSFYGKYPIIGINEIS